MGDEGIILLVLSGLALLIIAAFFANATEQNRKQRMRQESFLLKKSFRLRYMLDSFPDEFISHDLKVLIYRSILSIYARLTRLNPKNPLYQQDMQIITNEYVSQSGNPAKLNIFHNPLSDKERIKEIKQSLEILSNYVKQLVTEKAIDQRQAAKYQQQIHERLHYVKIDALLLSAQQAEDMETNKLALHYYNSALSRISSAGLDRAYCSTVEDIKDSLWRLEESMRNEMMANEFDEVCADAEWEKFEAQDQWQEKRYF